MDIPAEVLKMLKCSSCGSILSHGPVYLQHNGQAACELCVDAEKASRNLQYEAVAQLLRYPCRYQPQGCMQTFRFTSNGEQVHEADCDYRIYQCPLTKNCPWQGTKYQLLPHSKYAHSELVLENPCTLTHNLNIEQRSAYLVATLHILFLLITRVCKTTNHLYYTARLLGSSRNAAKYNYTLEIQRNDANIKMKGSVGGFSEDEKSKQLDMDIGSLMNMLGGNVGATFTVTFQQVAELLRCVLCDASISILRYRTDPGWLCQDCAPPLRTCNHGCDFLDIDEKCKKHESFFCALATRCWVCPMDITAGMLHAHYSLAHKHVTYPMGTSWRMNITGEFGQFCLLSNCEHQEIAMCWYRLSTSRFTLNVYVGADSAWLYGMRCVVRVTHPITAQERTFVPELVYSEWHDWRLVIKPDVFDSWCDMFLVAVDVSTTLPT